MTIPAPTVLFRRGFIAAALFITVWGAKLAVINRSGTDLPFWDQWAKEGELLIIPWLDRGDLWRPLVSPHNEHRIAPTLALNLGLMEAGGQWDARVQCLASGGLHALLLTGLFLGWSRSARPGLHVHGALFLALLGAAPIAWENLLSGFQSQFHFLSGCSLLAAGGLLGCRARSMGWWGGLAAGGVALVSMGSGVLCAAPIAAVAILRARRPEARRDAVWTLGAALLIAGSGALLHSPTPWHDTLHARSAAAFVVYVGRCLAWPAPEWPWLAPLLWAPWLALMAHRLHDRRELPPITDFILAGGLWVAAQAAAVAYSRAGEGGMPASRYGDVFSLGLVFSLAALVILTEDGRLRRLLPATALAAMLALVGLAAHASWHGPLAKKQVDHAAYERNVQAFVLTGDYAAFEKQLLPFPLPDWLARILRHPGIRARLPASVRAPENVPGLAGGAPPAGLPALPGRNTRIIQGPAEWKSGPLPAGTGWWKIETAGDVGHSGATLALVSVTSGRVLAEIAPSRPAGLSWRAAYVGAPREEAQLVARVTREGSWMAFSEPVVQSSLGHAAWRLARQGGWIALIGLGALLAAIWVPRKR